MPKNNPPLIRLAEPADLPAINDIYNEAIARTTATFHIQPMELEDRKAWLDEHPPDMYPVYVAEVDGVIAGWAALSQYASRCAWRHTVEDSIYIAPEYQRKGIGALLLARLIEASRELQHHAIIAQISDHNAASIRLHEQFGFEIAGELREVGRKFDRWLDITLMEKIV